MLRTALSVPPSPVPCPWPAPAPRAALGVGPETSPHPSRWRHEEGPDMALSQPRADAGCPSLLSMGRTATSSRPAPSQTLPSPIFHLRLRRDGALGSPSASVIPWKPRSGHESPGCPPAPGSARAPTALLKLQAVPAGSGAAPTHPAPPACGAAPPCTPRRGVSLGTPPPTPCRRQHRRVGDACVPAGARPSTTSAATTTG